MRVKSYKEAVRLARCAGEDAATRRMRKAGRKAWSPDDHAHAASVTQGILTDLGFDIAGWIATSGVPSNYPGPPAGRGGRRRASAKAPVQLSFEFA